MKNNIKFLRAKQGLSQVELAQALEISRPALCNIENGVVNPRGSTVIRIANFFGIPAEQIFFENSVMHEEHNIM